MAKIKPFGGVIQEYDEVTYYSDDEPQYGNVVTVSYLCYRDYEGLLEELEFATDGLPIEILPHSPTSKILGRHKWINRNGQLDFPVFCSVCEDMLNLEPVMCCSNHRYRDWDKSKEATQNMIEMIKEGGYLCPYYTLLAINAGVLNKQRISLIKRFGKQYIPLFSATPAGILLYAGSE